jgi:hypothetical protein
MAKNFNTEPYFDDYDATKDFYRILFRPSYAVQARELTQLQTILQNQVSRFGNHVFKNGSQVIPGSVTVDNQYHFIKLEQFTGTTDVTTYIKDFKNKIITGETSGVKLRVVDTSADTDFIVDNLTTPTLYCKIEGTADDGITRRPVPGENITAYEADNQIATNFRLTESQLGDVTAVIRTLGDIGETGTVYEGNPSSDVLGYAYAVEVKQGIYYIDGVFVRNPDLKLYAGRFTKSPTCRVGFKVTESTVTPEDDDTILDNATGSYNFAAPGAHRYQIKLSLVKLDLLSTDNIKFVELVRVVDGRVQQKIEAASYAELEKNLARRTYDESGNYEVTKFRLSTREHLNNGSNFGVYEPEPLIPVQGVTYGSADQFCVVVDPGKAYIQGYEVESISSQFVTFDKARVINGIENNHVARVREQPVGLTVGNYVYVTNVYNIPDISTFEKVYLVKTLNATPGAGSGTYGVSNIIGTARVRAIQLHSGDYSAGTSTVYKLGLMDIQMYAGYSFYKDVKQITSQTSAGVFTCDIAPTSLDQVVGASATATNGSSTVGVTGVVLDGVLRVGDVVYVNNTRVGTVSSFTNLAITLTANFGGTTITGGALQIMRADIIQPTHDTLVFPLGYTAVKTLRGVDVLGGDTVKSSTVTVRRKFPQVSSSGAGSVSFDLNTYGATGETFLSDDNISNFLLIDTVTHLPVNITAASTSFDNDANRRIVTFSGVSNSRGYVLIASIKQVTTAAQEKTKTLTSTFDDIILAKNLTGATIELTKADAASITSIMMTPGSYDAYSAGTAIDITERYTLDNGHRDTYVTNSKLVLKPGYQYPSGAIRVTYKYYKYDSTGNYFSVDSYSTLSDYANIPNYSISDSSTGRKSEVCLSDVLDFRPVLGGTNTFYPELPMIGTDFASPVAYYLGRKDKLTVDSVGRFNVIKGVPSIDPQEPLDPKDSMVLATISIPPYTKKTGDIGITQRDNRRYTMADIGKLDRRISNLEYYVSLSLLEKDTATMQIKDTVTGLDKYKNGFLVDQFTGHDVGDVKHPDYKCAVDAMNKILRPMHETIALDIVEDLSSGSDRLYKSYKKSGDLITLPYDETTFIFNNHATRQMDITALSVGAFRGQVSLFPEGDNWKDTIRRPDLTPVDTNGYDAIKWLADSLGVTGAHWNEWQTNWASVTPSSTTNWEGRSGNTVTGYQTTVYDWSGTTWRDGINTSITTTTNAQDYGDRIVDMSYIPYMRARPVTFIAKNLKPLTKFWSFFDGTAVSSYVKPADKFLVQRVNTAFHFDQESTVNNVLVDDPRRSYKGQIEPAFSIGDVVTNSDGPVVSIESVGNLVSAASTFTVTLASGEDLSNIRPGHHVMFYNMDYHNAYTNKNLDDLQENQNIPASSGISSTTATSKELNLRKFKVISKAGQVLTLGNIDGTNVSAFSAYLTSSYTSGNRGKLMRLKASAVIATDGVVVTKDANGVYEQEIWAVNIKNGFAIGEYLTGTVAIGSGSSINSVTLVGVNDNNSQSISSTMKSVGDVCMSDAVGTVVGVFYLPNDDTLSFRTGERAFKLSDNTSNSDASFDSTGSASYYSQGFTLTKERTVVSSRNPVFVQDRLYQDLPARRTTSNTRAMYSYNVGGDPLAQTFTVASTGGCFVTSLDLFLGQIGTRPINVEIRTTVNGVPSTKILPFSQVTLTPQQMKSSSDSSVATTVTFPAPVFLQDGETYCFVILTDEPGTQVFVSELGKTDLLTGNVIGVQPLTGSLYASQNAKEWEINPLLDIKFVLRKAKFDYASSVDVLFKAKNPPVRTLPNNPIEITPGTNLIRVTAPNHGFLVGEKVVLGGFPKGYYGTASGTTGIPDTLLNREHTVYNDGLDKDTFVINLVTTDASSNNLLVGGTNSIFVKGEYGGDTITCSNSVNMDAIFLKTSDLNFQDTSIQYYIDTQDESGTFSGWIPVVSNSNHYFTSRQHIASYENQTILSSTPLLKKSSVLVKAVISSLNENVSPVVDLQKISAYAIANLVDEPGEQEMVNVAEIDTRTLLKYGDLTSADVTTTGSGTITTLTSSTTVTGVGTSFTTQVANGNILKKLDGTTIGTVSSVTNDTTIVLTGNAAVAVSALGFKVVAASPVANLSFANVSGYGVISTNIDSADNQLANADIGKYITISNAHANVNGTYLITNIQVLEDKTAYLGNPEYDKINITVTPAFTGSATIDMITTSNFAITMQNKFVEDVAPIGATNYANYITRPLALSVEADSIKILFDASVLNSSSVKVYYRTWNGTPDLRKVPFIDTGWVNDSADVVGVFREREINLNNLTAFRNVQIKIAMRTTNHTQVPMIKNFRLLALS